MSKQLQSSYSTLDDTPLTKAIKEMNIGEVTSLLENGENPNVFNRYNSSPLIIACQMGQFEMVKLLVQYNADINLGNDSFTLLHYACECNFIENISEKIKIIEYLISKGANVNENNNTNDTPLIVACRYNPKKGENNLVIARVKLLLENNANATIINNLNENALILASKCNNFELSKTLIDFCITKPKFEQTIKSFEKHVMKDIKEQGFLRPIFEELYEYLDSINYEFQISLIQDQQAPNSPTSNSENSRLTASKTRKL